MDNSGHRENGRHKVDQYKTVQTQWLMQQQPSMKQIMAMMADRDAAIQERNLAISEKKQALIERDMALMQRDTAIEERNNALLERDNALATLQYRTNSMNPNNNMQQQCPESPYNTCEMYKLESVPLSPIASEAARPSLKGKRSKEPKSTTSNSKKPSKSSKKAKKEDEGDDFNFNHNTRMFGKHVAKSDWKGQDLGLNLVVYDESTMPAPYCSCTGTLRQCYKWGNGGWQSSCCTTTLSMYPLPSVPNKRQARVGGRKMSGSAYNKLLSRLAGEGYDLSNPVDLKDNWAKHGTNRYITIK